MGVFPQPRVGTGCGCRDRPSGSVAGADGSPGSRRGCLWRPRTQRRSGRGAGGAQGAGRPSAARSASPPPGSSSAGSQGAGCPGGVQGPACLRVQSCGQGGSPELRVPRGEGWELTWPSGRWLPGSMASLGLWCGQRAGSDTALCPSLTPTQALDSTERGPARPGPLTPFSQKREIESETGRSDPGLLSLEPGSCPEKQVLVGPLGGPRLPLPLLTGGWGLG